MYIIIGASSGVGRSIAEEFARNGQNLLLVSRENRDTDAVATDLKLRFRVSVKTVRLDLAVPTPDFSEIANAVDAAGTHFGGLLIPAGTVLCGDDLNLDSKDVDGLFRVNCLSICKLIGLIISKHNANSPIALIGFGSIASVRGRQSNIIYSAAKAALRLYFESLRHACVGRRITVQFYLLGYMNTNLAFAYRVPMPKADPQDLARVVYRDLQKDVGVRFFPRYWLFVSMILRMLPWMIYKRLMF